MLKELTLVNIIESGHTEPDIPFGTPVLLIYRGEVNVGVYSEDTDGQGSVYTDHPTNQNELDPIATERIARDRPELLNTEKVLFVTCPDDIARQMKW